MRMVIVAFQREAVHCWPDAPGEQGWLAYPHMHNFRIEVKLEVAHNDREVEFFAFRDELSAQWDDGVVQQSAHHERPAWSCEKLAEQLADWIQLKYPERFVEVGVWEDKDFGAVDRRRDK